MKTTSLILALVIVLIAMYCLTMTKAHSNVKCAMKDKFTTIQDQAYGILPIPTVRVRRSFA